MIIERYDKRRKCIVFDVRLLNEYGKMQYYACGHTKKTLVREYEAKLKNQIKEWKAFPERKIKKATFTEFVDGHYIPIHANSLSSAGDYLSICRKLLREFGVTEMEAVDRYACESYLKRRYSEVSVYMANREFAILKGIFTKAEEWGFRSKGANPCRGINLKKEEPRFRVYSDSEVNRLLAQCKKGCGDFYLKEFHGRLSVEKLCNVLMNDGYSPIVPCNLYTIEWLNSILLITDLYDRIVSNRSFKPSKRLNDLKKKNLKSKDESDLVRFNRVLIEEVFPHETPKMPKKAVGLSQEEAVELRDKIEITLNCGPRKDELLNIQVDSINFETGMLRILGKGNKIRFVPMNEKARAIFSRRLKGRKGNEYIFGDGKVAPKDFVKAFHSLCEHAEIENARIHDLRRTFGTRCAIAGVPPKTLQKWMGHEDIKTTMKYYVQIPEQYEKEAIERLSAFGEK